jgi:hypothetical protein
MTARPSIAPTIGRKRLPSPIRSVLPSPLRSPSIALRSAFFHPPTPLGAIEAPSRAHSTRLPTALRYRCAWVGTLSIGSSDDL